MEKLIGKMMRRADLKVKSGRGIASLAKVGKSENLITAVSVKIYIALDCDISEIMEVVPEDTKPDNLLGIVTKAE